MVTLRVGQVVQAVLRREVLCNRAALKHAVAQVFVGVLQDDALQVQAGRWHGRRRVLQVLVLVKRNNACPKPLGAPTALRGQVARPTSRSLVILEQGSPNPGSVLSSGV